MTETQGLIVGAALVLGYWGSVCYSMYRFRREQHRQQQELFNKARGGMKL